MESHLSVQLNWWTSQCWWGNELDKRSCFRIWTVAMMFIASGRKDWNETNNQANEGIYICYMYTWNTVDFSWVHKTWASGFYYMAIGNISTPSCERIMRTLQPGKPWTLCTSYILGKFLQGARTTRNVKNQHDSLPHSTGPWKVWTQCFPMKCCNYATSDSDSIQN